MFVGVNDYLESGRGLRRLFSTVHPLPFVEDANLAQGSPLGDVPADNVIESKCITEEFVLLPLALSLVLSLSLALLLWIARVPREWLIDQWLLKRSYNKKLMVGFCSISKDISGYTCIIGEKKVYSYEIMVKRSLHFEFTFELT